MYALEDYLTVYAKIKQLIKTGNVMGLGVILKKIFKT